MKGTSIIIQKGPDIKKFRKEAILVAKEIGYPKYVIENLNRANTLTEIEQILAGARHEWDVNPGRYFNDYDEFVR